MQRELSLEHGRKLIAKDDDGAGGGLITNAAGGVEHNWNHDSAPALAELTRHAFKEKK